MKRCKICGSYAFNLYKEDIDQGNLCDVHYWKEKALAQPEQRSVSEHLEPVAYLVYDHGAQSQYLAFDDELGDMDGCEVTPLYTHPPVPTQQSCSQRTAAVGEDSKRAWVEPCEWRGLTDEEIVQCQQGNIYHFYHCIEAKLKEKNTRNGGCL